MSQKKKIRILIISVIAVLVIAGAATGIYVYGSYQDYKEMEAFYSEHFLPETSFNGVDVSDMTANEVEQMFLDELNKYSLTITGRDESKAVLTPEDIALSEVYAVSFEQYLSQQKAFEWNGKNNTGEAYELDVLWEFDESLLENWMQNQDFFREENFVEPVDAHIEFSEEDNLYRIIPEVMGNRLDLEETYIKVKEAIAGMNKTLDLEEAELYTDPTIYEDNEAMAALKEQLNQYVAAKITYTFGSNTEVVDAKVIKECLSWDENFQMTFDSAPLSEFVTAMRRTYNTFKTGESRTFKTHTGATRIISGGDYGWWMNVDDTLAELVAAVEAGAVEEKEVIWFQTASSFTTPDYGNSYVEIDLDNQHLYLYVNGSLILDSPLVSGNVKNGQYTPEGVYALTYKEEDAVLTGPNYRTPVDYWMPFNGDIGMHDAIWRQEFGGTAYITGGSNGCINLPYSAAQKIFGYVEKGFPVICYGGVTTYTPPETEAPAETESQPESTDATQADTQPDADNTSDSLEGEGA